MYAIRSYYVTLQISPVTFASDQTSMVKNANRSIRSIADFMKLSQDQEEAIDEDSTKYSSTDRENIASSEDKTDTTVTTSEMEVATTDDFTYGIFDESKYEDISDEERTELEKRFVITSYSIHYTKLYEI